ncbi:MAG: hypothetical protein H0V01_14630 [Bacteroidetes bacterium]|nr:hypothetical protein [Bacteroidota bacterium]HET6242920.1 hypothetical protein [Bacteroidia bacterium]
MKTKLQTLPFVFIFFILIGCHKTGPVGDCNCPMETGKTRLMYQSTNCDDPWGYANSRENTAALVVKYFNLQGINFSSIGFDEKGITKNCYSCNCVSEIRICVQVNENDVLAMMENGFAPF